MNPRLILGGLKSYLPLPERSFTGTGGTSSADYSYSVWFRHLSLVSHALGGNSFKPETVVEIGPGDSVGTGLAALMSVANTYIGLDVLEHASQEVNLRVLDEIVQLMRKRADVPGDSQFPRVFPRLPSYEFPVHLIDSEELARRLGAGHLAELRKAMRTMSSPDNTMMRYCSPWRPDSVAASSVDYVFSQAALNDMDHTAERDDLVRNISSMVTWLKPGGVMSHQIELSCEGGQPWNHHWVYGPRTWNVIRGKRPYYKNRVPMSEYIKLFADAGCPVVATQPVTSVGLPREATARQFRDLPDEDFKTSSVFIVAVKKA